MDEQQAVVEERVAEETPVDEVQEETQDGDQDEAQEETPEEEQSPIGQVMEKKYEYSIEPLAIPYQVVAHVPYEDLRTMLDYYFKSYEASILKKFPVKGKKSKGGHIKNAQTLLEKTYGIVKLYSEVLTSIFFESMKEEILFVRGLNFQNFVEGKIVQVVAHMFLYPELEINDEISYSTPNPLNLDEEAEWENRKKEAVFKNKMEQDFEGDIITHDEKVLLDVIASREGKPDDDSSFRGQWFEMRHAPKALAEAVMKQTKGDLFETEYDMPDLKTGEMVHITAHIKIHDVKTVLLPEIDDDLAKTEGFENMDEFRAQFAIDFQAYKLNAVKIQAYEYMVNEIITHSRIPQFPEEWLIDNAKTHLTKHVQNCGGNSQKAFTLLGADNEGAAIKYMRNYVIQEGLKLLAIKKFCQIHGLEPAAVDVAEEMANRITWTDPAPAPAPVEPPK